MQIFLANEITKMFLRQRVSRSGHINPMFVYIYTVNKCKQKQFNCKTVWRCKSGYREIFCCKKEEERGVKRDGGGGVGGSQERGVRKMGGLFNTKKYDESFFPKCVRTHQLLHRLPLFFCDVGRERHADVVVSSQF